MLRKSFFIFMLVAFAGATFAADTVALDLNYWCRGNLKLLNTLPDGVTMSARRNYTQKKFAHICLYTVRIDMDKAREFTLELEVVDTGDKDSAMLNPSLAPSKGLVVDCLKFDINGKAATGLPRKIKGWTGIHSVKVKPGDKITISCKLEKSTATSAKAASAPAPAKSTTASARTVALDLNYWCRGNLKLLNTLPDGVTMSARRNYSQKKFSHICLYTVRIDVDKAREFTLELEVVDTGDKDSAKLNPSLAPSKGLVVECLEFETGEEPSSIVPCKITKWTGMQSIEVSAGEKITLKCKLRPLPAAQH